MFKYIQKFFINYQARWLAADVVFISDTLANSILGTKYYEIFSYLGFKPELVNTILSILELIRLFILITQRHNNE